MDTLASAEGSGAAQEPAELPDADAAGEAVELLLEEVNEESQPQPSPHFADLRGRAAVVTGGATGIGRHTAIGFARCGVNVAFNWFDLPGRSIAEAAERTRSELQQLEVRVLAERVDVRDSEQVAGFVSRAMEHLGGLHFLVNAAGVHRSAVLWKMTDEQWQDVLDTNLTGAFHTLRAMGPHLRKQRFGKVVNIASLLAFQARVGVANYAASKAGLVALTRSAAAELGPSNINVNAVAPGFIRTDMLGDIPEDAVQESVSRSALGRIGLPQDVTHLVLFLCSEMSRHITGEVIRVDGGMLS